MTTWWLPYVALVFFCQGPNGAVIDLLDNITLFSGNRRTKSRGLLILDLLTTDCSTRQFHRHTKWRAIEDDVNNKSNLLNLIGDESRGLGCYILIHQSIHYYYVEMIINRHSSRRRFFFFNLPLGQSVFFIHPPPPIKEQTDRRTDVKCGQYE